MAPIATPPVPTKFKDPLRIPPVLRPVPTVGGGYHTLRIRLRPARVRLHSELPPTDVWAYDGHFPGPTIEVRRGERLAVEWANDLAAGAGNFPLIAVKCADPADGAPPEQIPQNRPGRDGGTADVALADLTPWTVAHLHGGRTAPTSDGWTENAALPGQATLARYDNDQPATLLWYHDHAMSITRYNVMAGLAGLYLIRDGEEAALGLPGGEHEVPLLIQDRNLDVDGAGALTGRLLHKIEASTNEFFGPFTLVNGTIWPHLDVAPRQYRFRVLNGSNARTYRLVLLDGHGHPVPGAVKQIGTDGGLLGAPVDLPSGGLILAPAERADLLIDFRAFRGARLTLVNTAGAPFGNDPASQAPGMPDPANRLPHPEVLQFRVGHAAVADPFVLPSALAPTFARLDHDSLPHQHAHRWVALVEDGDTHMLTLRELQELPADDGGTGESLVVLVDATGVSRRFRTVARQFEDTVNFFVAYGGTEVWNFLNTTEDTHPMHVHLVQFQLLRRDIYDSMGKIDPVTGATTAPIAFVRHGALDANEAGWKDTVRVNPGEHVAIAATFTGYTGRYMYHCHVIEHEDRDMMRPFVVLPADVLARMGMDSGGHIGGMPM